MINDPQLPPDPSAWARLAVGIAKAAADDDDDDGSDDDGDDKGAPGAESHGGYAQVATHDDDDGDELAATIRGEGLLSCGFRAHLPVSLLGLSQLPQSAAALTTNPMTGPLHFLLHAEASGFVTVNHAMNTGQASSSSPALQVPYLGSHKITPFCLSLAADATGGLQHADLSLSHASQNSLHCACTQVGLVVENTLLAWIQEVWPPYLDKMLAEAHKVVKEAIIEGVDHVIKPQYYPELARAVK
jgi:hypothetical protein